MDKNKIFDDQIEKILRKDYSPEIDDNARKIAVNLAMAEFKNAQNEKESQKKSNNFQGVSFLSRLMGRSTQNGRDNTMENKSKKRFIYGGAATALAVVFVGALSLSQLQETVTRNQEVEGSAQIKLMSGKDAATDPVYIEAIEHQNKADLDRALSDGTSAIPVPTGTPELRLEVPQKEGEANSEDPLHRWRALQEERTSRQLSDDSLGAQATAKPADPAETKEQAAIQSADKPLHRWRAVQEAPATKREPEPLTTPESVAKQKPTISQDRMNTSTSVAAEHDKVIIVEPRTPDAFVFNEHLNDKFEKFEPNSFEQVASNPVSTFSSDVDTASYAFVRKSIHNGRLPHPSQVRTEEMVNYFTYNYPVPASRAEPFKPTVTVMDSPWAEGRKLMHIGIKGYEVEKGTLNSNLVFLLDVSGSMNSADKLPLVKSSMRMLLDTLSPSDTISIVTYAGSTGVVLEPTPVSQKNKILNALENLRAGGGTAGAAGIELAYQKAEQNFKENAVNRVILATDGDFNVGITDREELKRYIERKREKGIFLSILGFGTGNYNDHLMQTLAQNGNGTANYIDSLKEAQKVLVDEATSALFPIAKDVKFQVEFNPNAVAEYRLIGYETRSLKREDFNNDKIDAGDIGAGHSVTAIYEFVPVGSDAATIDPLRYSQKDEVTKPSSNANEYAFVKIRYKLPMENTSKLITQPVPVNEARFNPNEDVRFSIAVSAFAQILQGGTHTGQYSYEDVMALAQSGKGADPYGYRAEFISMVRLAKSLQR